METPVKEITLPSGKTAQIRQNLTGKDGIQAQRVSGTDMEKFLPAIISVAVTIDGLPIVYEDIEAMPLKDYMELMKEVADVAF